MAKSTAEKRIDEKAEQVRKDLIDQLEARGLVTPAYMTKANEYADLYRHRERASLDVDRNGLTYLNSAGAMCENPCARAERDYSRCMLNILKFFGLTTDKPVQNPADDEL